MMGLAYLVFFSVYLLVSVAAVRGAIGYARKNGKSANRWGWGAAIVMYSLVFWDWLPTVAVHQFYCAKDSGFWVYKTLDQWKAENPGVMEGLHSQALPSRPTTYGDVHILDERFVVEFHRKNPFMFLPTTLTEQRLVDVKTDEILAKAVIVGSYVNPATDGLRGYKFWLGSKPCLADGIDQLMAEIRKMENKK
jgi:hypothetical protein